MTLRPERISRLVCDGNLQDRNRFHYDPERNVMIRLNHIFGPAPLCLGYTHLSGADAYPSAEVWALTNRVVAT